MFIPLALEMLMFPMPIRLFVCVIKQTKQKVDQLRTFCLSPQGQMLLLGGLGLRLELVLGLELGLGLGARVSFRFRS